MGKIIWTHKLCFLIFYSKKIDDHPTLEAHPFTKFLEGFQKVLDEATSLGLIINDKQSIILVLVTLPLSFHLFISTHGNDPTSNFVVVVEHLLQSTT
jgi:hypothetical protein